MTVHRFPSGGPVPPSQVLSGKDGAPGAGPARDGTIAAAARGPLRLAFDRLLVVAFSVAIVVVATLAGLAIAAVALAVFLGWATLYGLWLARWALIGLGLALAIAALLGWL